MPDLVFTEHAWKERSRDSISEDDVYHVVEDADDIIEQVDGRTRYTRTLDDGREVVVLLEDDDQTVVTAWEWRRRRPRRR